MPQIGPLEIVVILLVALVVFGPSRLPEVGKQAAKGLREFKRFQSGIRSDIQGMLDDDEHEDEQDDEQDNDDLDDLEDEPYDLPELPAEPTPPAALEPGPAGTDAATDAPAPGNDVPPPDAS
jgi:TatA/E family protein of Tat protein translocase